MPALEMFGVDTKSFAGARQQDVYGYIECFVILVSYIIILNLDCMEIWAVSLSMK